MARCVDADDDSPFDASPTSPASAVLEEEDDGRGLPHAHRAAVHRTAGNRASGDHVARIAQAVRAEERLYEYHQQQPSQSPQSDEGRVQPSVGQQSTLWTRRQRRTQPQADSEAEVHSEATRARATGR